MPELKTDEPKKIPQPMPMQMRLMEIAHNRWTLDVVSSTQPEDCLSMAFWSHIAAQLRPQDEITIWSEDMSWCAEYLIIDSGQNWAKAVFKEAGDKPILTRMKAFQPMTRGVMAPGYTVGNGGTMVKWRVVRDADAKVIRDKFQTESDAYAWLADWSRSQGAS